MSDAVRGATLAFGLIVATAAASQDAGRANTLQELSSQFSSCLAKSPLSTNSRITIVFALRRDGSAFGKPRISYSHLEGDADQQQRFLAEVRKAIDSCLPLKVTPALGGAIAGRLFTVTLGASKPEKAI
jgi:hypothetical protein